MKDIINSKDVHDKHVTILDKFTFNTDSIKKKNCDVESVLCFTNADCMLLCDVKHYYSCDTGKCNKYKEHIPINTCDPKLGYVSFLAADIMFNEYKFICKSNDPGIAIDDDKFTNKMCFNGTRPTINYLYKYPTIHDDCKCPDGQDKTYVPATKYKREHIECSPYYDMVKY